MDAEVSYGLKYGCLGHGGLALRLMAVSCETGSVKREELGNIFFFPSSTSEVLGLLISEECEFTQ